MASTRVHDGRRGVAALAASLSLLLVLLAMAAVRPPAAAAGGVGVWSNLTGKTGSNLTQVGLLATPDGLLHVTWIRDAAAPGKQDLLWRDVKPAGAFTAPKVLESGWSVLNDPSPVALPAGAGIASVFSGMRSTAPTEMYDGVTLTTSTDGGATWTLFPGGVIDPAGSTAYSSPISAAVSGGVLWQTWYGTNGVWVHGGMAPGAPAYDYQAALGSYGYYSNLGVDHSGDLWLAWASNATGHSGVYVARVDQTSGAPLGPAVKLAGTTTKYAGSQQFDMMLSRVPVTGRPNAAGVFVAYPIGYPSTKTVKLWKVTPTRITSTTVAGGGSEKGQTAVASDAKGRIWVVWSQQSGAGNRVFVRRSNASVTSFGPAASYATPRGYPSVYHLAAAARGGKLDVFAHVGGAKGEATWHIQFAAP